VSAMKKKRVLIIDDNRTLALTAERVLQKQGYDTQAAMNGREGLERAQEWQPDIIILDIVMPGMDGYEVGRQLRQHPRTASIPIIFLSAKGNTDEKEGSPNIGLKEINRAFRCGANDFLHKPVAAADLIYAVENILKISELISKT
jgi:CheY-like chemotaxis protein